MGSSWVNVKSEKQAWRLKPQAGAVLLSWGRISSSSEKPQVLLFRPLTDWMRPSVLEVISSTSVLMMDVNHTCKIPSWQCQDQCLNHWRLAWPSWHRKLTITVPIKFLWFEKLQRLHYYYYICSPSGFALKSIFCGELNKWAWLVLCIHDRELLGKEQCLLEILKCSVPSPDLWPSGVRGLVQTWAGRTVSLSWSLPLPHPVSVVGLSNVSVWVTVFPAPGRLCPAGLVACILVSDSWSDPKCCEIYRNLTFPQSQGERRG